MARPDAVVLQLGEGCPCNCSKALTASEIENIGLRQAQRNKETITHREGVVWWRASEEVATVAAPELSVNHASKLSQDKADGLRC